MRRRLLLLALFALSACATTGAERLVLSETDYTTLPGWHDDDHAAALETFLTSCDAWKGKSGYATHGQGELAMRVSIWHGLCRKAAAVTPGSREAAHAFFEENFLPFEASNNDNPDGLLTGYYEPMLNGSRTRKAPYVWPVYALPDDVGSGPYLTREQIDGGALKGRGLELAWVDDPVMLFFLHIQGSGRVLLDSGEVMRIGYAGKNNQPYVAVGKLLVERGKLEKASVSMQSIRDWMYASPREGMKLMHENPSYVFFRELAPAKGPIGAQGVPLTAGRSLAVDSRFIPYGMPIFIRTQVDSRSGAQEFKRLMVAQDTGGAIRGPIRGDIFFGAGPDAEWMAGHQKQPGRWVALVPRAAAGER